MPGKKIKQCKVTLEGQDDTHAATLYVNSKSLYSTRPPFYTQKPCSLESGRRTGPWWDEMAFAPSHQNLGSRVGQAQAHESATHKHGGSQQDGDCFGNADQGAEY